ncbi:MAG: GAF domain-containing protein [Candidatus Obscuribacterales bacterium]|nr:GAF domain-containing protein [Candidatus Obscuribacterales bacterium]
MTQSIAREPNIDRSKSRELTSELYLKSEQLLRFRIAFSLVSLCLCVGIYSFAGVEFEFYRATGIICSVSIYSFIGLSFVVKALRTSRAKLQIFNSILLVLDALALTGLVHFTHGIESDLYVLYLLPIMLSSYTFGRRGIYLVAAFVALCYIGLLVYESSPLLPYLLQSTNPRGLASAFALKLWRRIFARAFFFTSVAFLWARFCDYLSRVSRRSNERLLEQLEANEKLIAESEERAKRERLINSINKGVRSTLELDSILRSAVNQLSQAVSADLVAILCPPTTGESNNIYVQASIQSADHVAVENRKEVSKEDGPSTDTRLSGSISARLQSFILSRRSSYLKDEAGKKIKTFVFSDAPADQFFADVKEEIEKSGFRSVVLQPMMYGEISRGVIILADRRKDKVFEESELVLTKVVAGQVAVAIEHANLVGELSSKNRDLVGKNLNLDAKNLELKTMQSQLIHHEKMASLGRLVAGIAHELNNPINFVHGNLPYLKQYADELKKLVDKASEIEEEHRREFDELKRKIKYDFLISDLDNIIADLNEGSERIRHIIRNLRSFSRLDEAELKEASISEGIESTLKILSQYYGNDKIPVHFSQGFSSMPQVLCYPGQLNQVWMNLLSNAAQAMQGQAEARLNVQADLEGESVLVQISDNGPGIKQEVQSKIFDPFFTTKPVGQGTGLGLSICHSIIERHGGQIWFSSELGKGTTFFVRIPLTAKRQSPNSPGELSQISEPD